MKTVNHKRRPAKRRFATWKIVLAVVVVLMIAVIGCTASFLKLYKPSVDTDVPFDTSAVSDDTTTAPSDDPITTDTSVPVTEPVPSSPTYVRDTDSVNVLVLGEDVASTNTDVFMLVNFNMREGSLSVMQIPRDSYIEINGSHRRINTALARMRSLYVSENPKASSADKLKGGMEGVVELLEKSLCIQIDGYVHVNLEGFRSIINTLGGVKIDVPYAMDYEDPAQDLYIHLSPGVQTLNGEQAEMFIRFRSGYVQADIGRIDAQKIFLTALFKQLKSSLTISTVPKLVEQVVKYVTTDVPLADIIIYAKELLGVDMDNISMMTLHGSSIQTESGAWYYVMNRASALNMINEYFNVYDQPVTDEIFDVSRVFTDDDDKVVSAIYTADPDDALVQVKPDVETGTQIDNGELDIQLIK